MGKMSINKQIGAVMSYYRELENNQEAPEWTETRQRFTPSKANSFFLGVTLDMRQPAERAWCAGRHLATNHFKESRNFWDCIANTHLNTIKRICKTGYDEKHYMAGHHANRYPIWLKENAKKIVVKYGSDVRNVWNVRPEDVNQIYYRFMEFSGIGHALASMAQFILVRSMGVAGGVKNREQMKVKPDEHVRRVLYRLGISGSQDPESTKQDAEGLNLKSPADFDWAIFNIGREYCRPRSPKCSDCPLCDVCEKRF